MYYPVDTFNHPHSCPLDICRDAVVGLLWAFNPPRWVIKINCPYKLMSCYGSNKICCSFFDYVVHQEHPCSNGISKTVFHDIFLLLLLFYHYMLSLHSCLQATRSEVFRTMLETDEIKAPAIDTISLPELNHEELHCLLEFLYCGSLPNEKVEKHAFSLLIAADKYNIPFLKKFCEIQILRSLDSSNALEVLEISEVCSNNTLKESAMNSIVKHMEDVVFSSKYDEFAVKNAHLCVLITRALLKETKEKRCDSTQYI